MPAAWPAGRNNLSTEAAHAEADPHLDSVVRWRFRDTTVFGVRGEATLAGFARVSREFLADPTPQALWDMREYSVSSLARGQLRWLVGQLMRSDPRKRPRGRSAFVCPGDADYNVLRVLIAYAEAHGYGVELAVFRDIDEARGWLFDRPSRSRSA
jgi:hypothetical protein